MDKLKQLFYLLLFSYIGEVLSLIIAPIIAIPGSVIGMIVLFLALHFNILALEKVEEVGTWLSDNMAFLFVPAGVGLMTQFDILTGNVWWQILIILFVTTVLMMWFVGIVVQKLKQKKELKQLADTQEVSND